MKLTFLGQPYETTTSDVALEPSTLTGKYRGTPMRFSRSSTGNHDKLVLIYRGQPYTR